MIVTMRDVRAARMCSKGARQWFDRYGLDWSDFIRNGIDADLLIATGDGMALRVVEVARGRQ